MHTILGESSMDHPLGEGLAKTLKLDELLGPLMTFEVVLI